MKKLLIFIVSIIFVTAFFYNLGRKRVNSPNNKKDSIRPPVSTVARKVSSDRNSHSADFSKSHLNGPSETANKGPSSAVNSIRSNLRLIGTAIGSNGHSFAVIEQLDLNEQYLSRVGDSISGGVIVAIQKDRVILRIDGEEVILMAQADNAENTRKRVSDKRDTVMNVRRSYVEENLKNVSRIVSGFSLKPRSFEDGSGGLQLSEVKPGSFLDGLGFRKGDIIQEIDGARINHPYRLAALYDGVKSALPALPTEKLIPYAEDLMLSFNKNSQGIANQVSKLYTKFESGDKIVIRVRRGGRIQNLVYQIK